MKLVALLAVAVLATASALLTSNTPVAADATISVSLSEFALAPSASSAAPGTITFNVSNNGAIIHDFHVVDTALPADSLPVNMIGEVDMSQVNEVANTPIIQPGGSDSTAPQLGVGSYVLLCNLPGHYSGGMYAAFTIQAPANTPTGGGGGGSPTPDGNGDGGTGGTGGTDDGTGGTGGTDTGGSVGSPTSGYGPDAEGTTNAWFLALPAAIAMFSFGTLALRRIRRD